MKTDVVPRGGYLIAKAVGARWLLFGKDYSAHHTHLQTAVPVLCSNMEAAIVAKYGVQHTTGTDQPPRDHLNPFS